MTLLWREVMTADYMAAVAARGGYAMTEPREDALTDPAKQDPSTDLPPPLEGNDDEDDTEEPADLGEDLEDEKQDQQTG